MATTKPDRNRHMFTELKAIVARSPATLAQDFAGAAALLVILLVGLSLPGLG